MELFTDVVAQYRDFAEYAVESPCLRDWSLGVATDPEVQEWIAALPPVKQQPNLVFAAARWHGVPAPGPYTGLRDALLGDDGTLRATVLARSTQTNEVGRLATLTPLLAQVAAESGRPLALLEVGASAGLCLYPDRVDYDWRPGPSLLGSGGPVLTCDVKGDPPLPSRRPDVAWRGGIDLAPIDVTDVDATAWLENLVWPEQDARRDRLRAALDVARRDPPRLVRGDLVDELPALVAEAAQHGEVVVFHSAVLAYLEEPQRRRFVDLVTDLVGHGACRWISNEGKGVLPDVTATGPPVPDHHPTFVLGLDGRTVAWTHGHGASMRWFGSR